MNNNDLGKKNALQQEDSEQLVWERLQNEAIAAQRWRLEQEMEQAAKLSAITPNSGFVRTVLSPWRNYSVYAAVATFTIVSLVFVFCCIW